jgi:hypothetical protein
VSVNSTAAARIAAAYSSASEKLRTALEGIWSSRAE